MYEETNLFQVKVLVAQSVQNTPDMFVLYLMLPHANAKQRFGETSLEVTGIITHNDIMQSRETLERTGRETALVPRARRSVSSSFPKLTFRLQQFLHRARVSPALTKGLFFKRIFRFTA